jgi:NtrC-family two-component system sensor histidine kinase KinB
MTLTLRQRIFLTLVPTLILIAVLGSAGVVLLYRLGNSIDAILRENYESIIAMERLNEALERIDSSFQFYLAGHHEEAQKRYERTWPAYLEALELERNNVTVPGEAELVARLNKLTDRYRQHGDAFYSGGGKDVGYHGPNGLKEVFAKIRDVSGQILRLNQDNMEKSSRQAQRLAADSVIWFGIGLVAAVVLAALSALHTVRTILRRIQAMRLAALGISAGNLDQVVPYVERDELGELAQAFNRMARHLRDYRQSHSAQLLRVQRTSQATIDSFPDPVIVLDAEGAVEMANPAARRLLGIVPRAKTDGQPADLWQPPEALRQPVVDALRGQGNYLPESFDRAILLGSSGSEHAFLPRILTIRDPYSNLLGAAVVLQDVTRLRLLDQVKSNLVATASHELKTPLTSLRLAIHLLLEEVVGPLTQKQMELLLDARENSERLLAVVNNLLDLARLEQGWRQLEIRPEAPRELLDTAVEAVRVRAQDRGVTVTVDAPPDLPPVAVDAGRLGHGLHNLLDNALTYTDRGGRIQVSAAAAGPDKVTFSVADTGIGIPAEHLPHVFEKFFRVPGQSRGRGTGLGLAIVNEIVTAHGGMVTCQSQPGVGTTFRFTVPVAARAPAPAAVEGRAQHTSKAVR